MHLFHNWKELRISNEHPVNGFFTGMTTDYRVCTACGRMQKFYDDAFAYGEWHDVGDLREHYKILKCLFEGPEDVYVKMDVPAYVLMVPENHEKAEGE